MSISLHKHIFLWATLLFSLVSTAFASFPDVSENTKYNQSITSLQDSWIVNGYSDGSFGPDNTITRAEFLWIIFKSRAIDTTSYSTNQACFPDVASDTWYSKYICYAKDTGYVNGYEDGNFGPNNPISKLEAVAIISKVFEYDKPEEANIVPYSDVKKGQWYTPYIQWLKDKKILDEVWDNFEATTNLKRGQMAEWSYRAILQSSDTEAFQDHLTQNVWCEDQSINTNEATCLNIYYLQAAKTSEDKDFLEPSTRQIEIPLHTSDVKLSYQWITEIHWLSQLKNLKTLDLGANYIQDIHFLKNVVSLEDLDLRDNWIWDLESLEDLTNLKKLNLNLNITGDPAPIWKLTNLEWLGLYKAEWLYHIDFLENLDNLKYLDVWEAVILDDELEVYKESHPEVEVSEDLSVFIGRKGDVFARYINFSLKEEEKLPDDKKIELLNNILKKLNSRFFEKIQNDEYMNIDDKMKLNEKIVWTDKLSPWTAFLSVNPYLNKLLLEELLNTENMVVHSSNIKKVIDSYSCMEGWNNSIGEIYLGIDNNYKEYTNKIVEEIWNNFKSDLIRKWKTIEDYYIDWWQNIIILKKNWINEYEEFALIHLDVRRWKSLDFLKYNLTKYLEISDISIDVMCDAGWYKEPFLDDDE